jgi:multicomponent Na+:H+ antiporter subunit B
VSRGQRIVFTVLIVILVCMVSYMLLLTVGEMPPYGQPDNPTNNEVMRRYIDKGVEESGGLNLVTNIILDYRAYDTLLETTVLFTAVMAIMLVLGVSTTTKQ